MKNVLITATAIALMSTSAMAERIQGTVIDMQETYNNVMQQVPTESCNIVDVPIYKEVTTGGGNAVEGAIGGAILGAIAGEVLGGKNERNAGAIFGAIVGGDKAVKKQQRETIIVGYRQQQQCTTTYTKKPVNKRGQNIVTVQTESGLEFKFKTNGWYARGSVVFMDVSLR